VGQSTKSFASDADAEGQLFAWLDAHARRLADFDALTDGDPHIRLYDVRTAFGSATAR
jgi:aminoglycoside N3'-acetyltransferase